MLLVETFAAAGISAIATRARKISSFDEMKGAQCVPIAETTSSQGSQVLRAGLACTEILLGEAVLLIPEQTDKNCIAFNFFREVDKMKPGDPLLPSETVQSRTADLVRLSSARELIPDQIALSSEGGSVVQFVRGHAYADIEFFNCGGVLAVIKPTGGEPQVWEVEWDHEGEVEESLNRIKKALALHGMP